MDTGDFFARTKRSVRENKGAFFRVRGATQGSLQMLVTLVTICDNKTLCDFSFACHIVDTRS